MIVQCMVPLLLALTACGTTRVIRLDTGQREPIVVTPRVRGEPVKLNGGEVKRAFAQLAREMHVPLAPQEAARRLFEVEERSGWYQLDLRSRRMTPLERGEHLQVEWSAAEAEITRGYLTLCERRGTPGDCMRLLVESPTVIGDGRYALAISFAKGAVLDEMEDAFKDMANPEAVLSAVLWTGTTYLLLLTAPEPVSKGIAAVMTVALIAWVGFDTFWSLIVGFKNLVEEADRATTFAEIRQAGERYGKVMGRNAARAFVMLATAAIGNTAAGLATKVPTLPGAAQAATQAGTQLGIRLSAVGAVTSVAVSADAVTISVASGAVMQMDAHGGTSGSRRPTDSVERNSGTTRSARRTTPLTRSEARELAERLGFKEVKDPSFNTHGQPAFQKGNQLITLDRDGHSGGTWKLFDRRGARLGTYNDDLSERIGD